MSGREKKEEESVEHRLGAQLGSDASYMATTGGYDMRRLSKINALDKVWAAHFMQVPDKRGGRYAKTFTENFLNLAVSEDGWRVNKMIQLVAGSKGAPTVGDLMKKPGWVGRNITNRDYERRAAEEGKQIVE